MQMLGDIAIAGVQPIPISNFGFLKNEILEMNFDSGIVGNILQIRLLIKGINEGSPYLCKRIVIVLSYKRWEFPCTNVMYDRLDDNGNDILWKLNTAGRTPMVVRFVVPTGGSTESPVWVKLHGLSGTTVKLLFRDNGVPEGAVISEVVGEFIGDIIKVDVFAIRTENNLIIKEIGIKYKGKGETIM